MAVHVFADAGIEVFVHEGPPPEDMTAQLGAKDAEIAALKAKIEAARAAALAAKARDAATSEGQDVLDALA